MQPIIIEVVPNGESTVARNPTVPRLPQEIATAGIDLLDRGASMIHNHIDNFRLCGQAAADRYAQGWAPILARRPDAILCPTTDGGATDADKIAQFAPCATAGARMAPLDPGSMNMPLSGGGVGEAKVLSYVNDFNRITTILEAMSQARLAPRSEFTGPVFCERR